MSKNDQNLGPQIAGLISAQTLNDQLDDPSLRIYDCTMFLLADADDDPYRVKSGEEDYLRAHIPGAAYIDLQAALSVADSPYRFTIPSPDDLAQRFAALGIGDDHRVVLYSRGSAQWATRIWWMLRSIGFDNALILDGGWRAWKSAGFAIETGRHTLPPAQLTASPRPGLFVGSDAMRDAIGAPQACTINALSADMHAGKSKRYGRPGRIPGSRNVPAASLLNPDTGLFIDPAAATDHFERIEARRDQQILIYCGGGIAATLDAFVLTQLGFDQVAVYDNSLSEWATTDSLPMEVD